jgi:hypothetical protein
VVDTVVMRDGNLLITANNASSELEVFDIQGDGSLVSVNVESTIDLSRGPAGLAASDLDLLFVVNGELASPAASLATVGVHNVAGSSLGTAATPPHSTCVDSLPSASSTSRRLLAHRFASWAAVRSGWPDGDGVERMRRGWSRENAEPTFRAVVDAVAEIWKTGDDAEPDRSIHPLVDHLRGILEELRDRYQAATPG